MKKKRYYGLLKVKIISIIFLGHFAMKVKVCNQIRVDHLKIVTQNSKTLKIGFEPATTTKNCVKFSVIRVTAVLGCKSESTKRHLKNMEWFAMNIKEYWKSKINVTFETLGLIIIQSPRVT